MALVIWEICRRVSAEDMGSFESCSRELPYYEFVSREPTSEDMQDCICVKKFRPTLQHEWQSSPVIFFYYFVCIKNVTLIHNFLIFSYLEKI